MTMTDSPATAAGTTTTRIAVITGSIRQDRFGPTVTAWMRERARRTEEVEVDEIDLAAIDLPVVLAGDDPTVEPPPEVSRLAERLTAADAFVIVTPVYNRSCPASLKNAIDWFYSPWQLKPVGIVSYGGATGGREAAEALRGIFAEFDAVTLADPVTFPDVWELFDEAGSPLEAEAYTRRAGRLLAQLCWWSRALREAHARRPFPHGGAL